MNFFKSILSEDQDPPDHRESDPNSSHHDGSNSGDAADGWSFGGLIRTFTIQSESVLETYRKDLNEFGSGLRKETEIFRETANRAVKNLPASLEAAHGALDGMLKSTTNIITRESLGLYSEGESETPGTNRSVNSGRYSRFEAQLSAIQSDLNTFCEEPEDAEDYSKWKLGFQLEDNRDEIDSLIGEIGILEGVYGRVVPNVVDTETFWCRYFYRVDKLKQQESLRASLVRRAISADDDEEELSWDFDDEEEDGNGNGSDQANSKDGVGDNVASDGNLNPVEKSARREGGNAVVELSDKSSVDVSLGEEEVKRDEKMKSKDTLKDNNDEKTDVEKIGESGKNSDASVVSSDKSKVVVVEGGEDMGWDEIENIGSGDEKKSRPLLMVGAQKKMTLGRR